MGFVGGIEVFLGACWRAGEGLVQGINDHEEMLQFM